MLDVFVDLHEFVVRRDVEAGSFQKQRLDDLRMGVGLYRVIALDPGQVFLEGPVIVPQSFMIQDKQRRSVPLRQIDEFLFHLSFYRELFHDAFQSLHFPVVFQV